MRLLLDLQACQAASMHRGIGRYSIALAVAIARNSAGHDLRIVLNSAFPDSTATLRQAFDGLVPPASISTFAVPLPAASLDPANGWRIRAAERIREQFLASLRPDMVHVASLFEGLSDDSVTSLLHGENRFDTAITLFDLIPLMRKERYLEDPNIAAWYYRKLQSLKNAELLLAISGHAREEAIEVLQLAPDSVVNISSAVDDIFRPRTLTLENRASLLARHGLHRPFIMYTGGIDYRKNIEGLIEAYAMLPEALRRQFQLAVICSIHEADRARLQRLAAGLHLADDDVVLTGFVSDDDLVSLYNCTALFVFPSLHEGFGLPALEAMACGAPVIGSNTSSIPEVIGRADAMFDPASVPAITAAMHHVLVNPGHADALRAHGLVQARLFSWDASAKRSVAAFEETHLRNLAARTTTVAVAGGQRRPRMAFVSPLPPIRSGIADYSVDLLPELARFYDVELVLAQTSLDEPWARHNFPQRSVDWFEAHAHEFDRIVYQCGNSAFHEHIFGLLERHPGIVILHDFFMSGIVSHAEDAGKLPNQYCRSLYLSHGYRAVAEERALGRTVSCATYPCNRAILDRAMGVIVHSNHSVELARHWYGPDASRDWRVVPLLRKLPGLVDRAAARQVLNIGTDDIVLCSFGMLAPTKCNDLIVEAWIMSAAGRDPRCHLVFVGELDHGRFGVALRARCATHPRIHISDYATESTYRGYLAAADAAVQLRVESRGETSAALLDCLSYGLPTIVNAHGSAAAIPPAVCLQLDDKFTTVALAAAIDTLVANAELRQQLAAAGRAWMAAHRPARAGVLVREAIEAIARDGQGALEQRLVQSIAAMDGAATDSDLLQVAAAIAANRPAPFPCQVFVDVTHLMQGVAADPHVIQQRDMLVALIAATPVPWRIEPVWHDGTTYLYARRFTLDLLGRDDLLLEDVVADAGAGNLLLHFTVAPSPVLPPAWQVRTIRQQAYAPGPAAAFAGNVVAQLTGLV